jgi:hypothetical protein
LSFRSYNIVYFTYKRISLWGDINICLVYEFISFKSYKIVYFIYERISFRNYNIVCLNIELIPLENENIVCFNNELISFKCAVKLHSDFDGHRLRLNSHSDGDF